MLFRSVKCLPMCAAGKKHAVGTVKNETWPRPVWVMHVDKYSARAEMVHRSDECVRAGSCAAAEWLMFLGFWRRPIHQTFNTCKRSPLKSLKCIGIRLFSGSFAAPRHPPPTDQSAARWLWFGGCLLCYCIIIIILRFVQPSDEKKPIWLGHRK